MQIDAIKVEERFRKDLGDIASLAESIREIGLLHPIVVTRDGRLIAGQRRMEAFKMLGRTEIPANVLDIEAIMRGELEENAFRKDFLPSELVAISREVEEEERRLARERQAHGGPRSGKLPERSTSDTRDRIAARVGETSGRTLEKARAIVEAAEKEPDRYHCLVDDMDRSGRVDGPYKRLKVMRQAEKIRCEPPPMPRGPFPVIVADPPWPYDLRKDDPSHRGITPYPQMTIEEICAFPLPEIAAEDCILWLWTTNAHMRSAFAVLDAWGFEQKTILTWDKDRMGTGHWLRGQTEHAIMAVRGRPTTTLTNQTTLLRAPALGHSRKPDEFFALVESVCPAPAGGYVSVFERYRRTGWISYGDQPEIPAFLDRRTRKSA